MLFKAVGWFEYEFEKSSPITRFSTLGEHNYMKGRWIKKILEFRANHGLSVVLVWAIKWN